MTDSPLRRPCDLPHFDAAGPRLGFVSHRSSAACRSGVEWLGTTRACRERLRELAGRAVQPAGGETYLFQARWKVRGPAGDE